MVTRMTIENKICHHSYFFSVVSLPYFENFQRYAFKNLKNFGAQ